jgi:hypothetical protein
MTDPLSRPVLADWRGEMILADLAYRSASITRGISIPLFSAALRDPKAASIVIPTDGSSYSISSITELR